MRVVATGCKKAFGDIAVVSESTDELSVIPTIVRRTQSDRQFYPCPSRLLDRALIFHRDDPSTSLDLVLIHLFPLEPDTLHEFFPVVKRPVSSARRLLLTFDRLPGIIAADLFDKCFRIGLNLGPLLSA